MARIIRDHDPKRSEFYQERALLAWKFLERYPTNAAGEGVPARGYGNPAGCHTGAYQDEHDADNRVWAAAELWRLTGEKRFLDVVNAWYKAGSPAWSANSGAGQDRGGKTRWAYVAGHMIDGHPVQNTYHIKQAQRQVIRQADILVRMVDEQPYASGDRLDVKTWIGWGKFTYATRAGLQLLQAWRLFPEREEYRLAAYSTLPIQLGAHPIGMSFVTGLGPPGRTPMDPTCEVCLSDDVETPYPGIPIFGTFTSLSNGHPYYYKTQHDANNYPYIMGSEDSGPALRRYHDEKQIIPESEFTITTMAMTSGVVTLLASTGSPPRIELTDAVMVATTHSAGASADGVCESVKADQLWVLLRRSRVPLTMQRVNPLGSCAWIFDVATTERFGLDPLWYVHTCARIFAVNL